MKQTISRAACLAAALVVPASAQNFSEALAVSASARFEAFAAPGGAGSFRPTFPAGAQRPADAVPPGFGDGVLNSAEVLKAVSLRAATSKPVASFELEGLLNRHLKTSLRYSLSGRTVWFSGAFDAQQNPFVSVLIDGSQPRYFNVRSLLNNEQHLPVGGANYTLSLSPNIFHKIKSTINLKNDANSREAARFSIQEMLDAVSAAGQPLALSDQSYKFYYADGVGGGGRMFAFIAGSGSDTHAFLVPEASVPTDRVGVFAMLNGKRVGLARVSGALQVFENP